MPGEAGLPENLAAECPPGLADVEEEDVVRRLDLAVLCQLLADHAQLFS